MPRVTNPQPGNQYKVVCADNNIPHKEVIFTFLNISPSGGYEIEVDGTTRTIGHFCDLCMPLACEVHSI